MCGPQRLVVASFIVAHIADIGDGETHPVAPVSAVIIGGAVVVVEEVERGGELVAAVEAHARGVDADGGHVAAHSAEGVAQAHGFGRALIVVLRKQAGVVGTLSK